MEAPASILKVLPPDVLVAILARLPCDDLLRTAATCKTFHSIISDPRMDERCASSCWGEVVQHSWCPAVTMQVAELASLMCMCATPFIRVSTCSRCTGYGETKFRIIACHPNWPSQS
jgi:hypothetical protein